jgi:hypothetical protein
VCRDNVTRGKLLVTAYGVVKNVILTSVENDGCANLKDYVLPLLHFNRDTLVVGYVYFEPGLCGVVVHWRTFEVECFFGSGDESNPRTAIRSSGKAETDADKEKEVQFWACTSVIT